MGRPVEFTRTIAEQAPGESKLEVQNLRVRGDRDELAVLDVNIDVRAGEVVGIVGVSGNGQRELAEPTRGIDIGAAEYIHKQLLIQRSQGKTILLISEDLDEVMALSERLVVMYEGSVMGRMSREGAAVEQVGLLMSGVGEPEGAAVGW